MFRHTDLKLEREKKKESKESRSTNQNGSTLIREEKENIRKESRKDTVATKRKQSGNLRTQEI